jgi:hypothetical protein
MVAFGGGEWRLLGEVYRFIALAGLLLELAGNVGPDGIARLFVGSEEVLGGVGDGLEVADERGAVGIGSEKLRETRIFAEYSALSAGEELRQILFELANGHRVEVELGEITH